jgi:hypothetical protein
MMRWLRRRREAREAAARAETQREWDMWMAFWAAMHEVTK